MFWFSGYISVFTRSLCVFGAICLLCVGMLPSVAFAVPTLIDTSTSQAATSYTSQRKTFYDTVNQLYWAFYYNGAAIEYSYSSNGEAWTQAGTLPYNTSYFSLSYRAIGGTPYVFLATEGNTFDIELRRGTLSAGSISFESPVTLLDGTSSSNTYRRPSIALDATDRVWVAAIRDTGAGELEHYQAKARRTTNGGSGDLSVLGVETSVGRKTITLNEVVLVPQTGAAMYLLANADSNNLVGYRFDGTSWGTANNGGDYSWFHFGGTINGAIYAIAISGGEIYIGGTFTDFAGRTEADRIARWDGNAWQAMGVGLGNTVRAIAVSAGNVYIGGDFVDAGGNTSADRITRWDGSAYQALGSGIANNSVFSIAVSGTDVYVGGSFTDAGGNTAADRIARFNGSAWFALGTGVNNSVNAVLVSGSDIYIGGAFTDAGGVAAADSIARFNGSSWFALGPGLNSAVNALAISGSNIYAGGAFTNAGGNANADRIAYYDGALWQAMGSGIANNAVNSLLVSGTDVYVGGNFTDAGGNANADRIARWNGVSWLALGTGVNNTVRAMSLLGADVVLGGDFTDAGGNGNSDSLSQWNGASYQPLGAGVNNTVRTIAVSGSQVYVGGDFTDLFGNASLDYIARFDGTDWNTLGAGLNNVVLAIAISGSDVYAGGSFVDAGGNPAADRVARFNGSSWSPLGTGVASTVRALAVSGSNLYLGGDFVNAGGNANADRIARWDGAAFQNLGTGIANNSVNAIAISGSNVYVGGSFTDAGGNASADRVGRFDGSAWQALGSGISNNAVTALFVSGTDLYVGGSFTDAGGNANADRIARFDGASWIALGTGLNNTVNAITVSGSDVYVGGNFTDAGGNANADRIARFDGASWQALGPGLENVVTAVSLQGSTVWTGGSFSTRLAYYGLRIAAASASTPKLSAVSDASGNIYLLYSDPSFDALFKRFPIATLSWTSPVTIQSGTIESLGLTYDSTDGALYATWIDTNSVLHKKGTTPYGAGNWAVAATTLYNSGTNRSVSSAATEGHHPGRAFISWTNGTGSPYSVYGSFSATDNTPPSISDVTSLSANGNYGVGAIIPVTVTFTEAVSVSALPELALNSGGATIASYSSGTGTNTLTFTYTVQSAENSADLDYASTSALSLSGGAIFDGAGNDATLTLFTPGAAGSLGANKDIVIDTQAPLAPIILLPTDGSLTNDNTPSISGTSEADATIEVFDGVSSLGTTTATGLGTWSFTPGSTLSEGDHVLSATALDATGNISALSATITVSVDTTAPTAPVITVPVNGQMTNDDTPTLQGTAEANSNISVYDGVTLLGTTTASSGGLWSFTPGSALSNGLHGITAKAIDAALNESSASSVVSITIDTVAPAAPIILAPVSPSLLSDNTPLFSGTAEANSTVTLFDGLTAIGTTVASGAGVWSYTPGVSLIDGVHSVTAKATDAASNMSVASLGTTITIDTTLPSVPTLVNPLANSFLSDNTPQLIGTGEVGATILIYDGAINLGSAIAGSGGEWIFTPVSALAEGPHSLTVKARDVALNESAFSGAVTVTVDTVAPLAPLITPLVDGEIVAAFVTNVTGLSEAGATIRVFVNAALQGTTIASSTGQWNYALALQAGTYSVTAQAVDPAGNESMLSPGTELSVEPNTYRISGKVVLGNATADPVVGAVVQAGNQTATTNELGEFAFENVSPGIYQAQAELQGYIISSAEESQEIVVSNQDLNEVNFVAVPSLGSPLYAFWNGFLKMNNVLELMNSGDQDVMVQVLLYNSEGKKLENSETSQVLVPKHGQIDLSLNQHPGFLEDSYGVAELRFNEGSVDGRMTYYRYAREGDGEGDAEGYEFVFSQPLTSTVTGSHVLGYNTIAPTIIENDPQGVEQWISIANISDQTKFFTVKRYNQEGEQIAEFELYVPPMGQRDIEAGHEIPGRDVVGVNKIIPHDRNARYLTRTTRYGLSEGKYLFAFSVQPRVERTKRQFAPILSYGEVNNYLELINTTGKIVTARLDFFAQDGRRLARNQQLTLLPYQQLDVDVEHYVPSATDAVAGTVRLQTEVAGTVAMSSVHYFRDRTTYRLLAATCSLAEDSFGNSHIGSYNRFLGMENQVSLLNVTSEPVTAFVTLFTPTGQERRDTVNIPAHGQIQLGFENEASLSDSYGLLRLDTPVAGSVLAQVSRAKTSSSGNFDFFVVTPMR